MAKKLWKWLQLFAEGSGDGSGGDAAAQASEPGVIADAADQRLREMGVPEDRIRRTKAGRQRAAARQAMPAQEAPEKQVAAAEPAEDEQPDAQEEATPKRMTWEEIMQDPEYNQKMQETMQKRLKSAKNAEGALNALMPAIKKLAQEKGLDPENVDYVSLGKMITGEYESKAMELGVPVETVMQLEQQQRTIEQQKMDSHFERLEREADAMKAVFPHFNLQAEMANPAFAKLTHPNIGMSVEDAYYAVHRKELQVASMQVAAQKTAQQISNAIQSGTRRPVESGQSTQAPSVTTFDYSRATKAQRDEFKAKLRASWARGEKVYPGR